MNHSPRGIPRAPSPATLIGTRQPLPGATPFDVRPRVNLPRLVMAIVAIACVVIWAGVGCAGFAALAWLHSSSTACHPVKVETL